MSLLMAILIGFLYAVSIYLLLRRSIVKLVIGILFLSYATNLMLFFTGGLTETSPAFAEPISTSELATASDPLPQALILTALVIGFGVAAFSMVLIYRFYKESGTVDLDELSEIEKS
ncbi:MAG TPA: NADH-quinone oxidoreductase subunit K [Bacteroidales bacterium]|jgi:multicomponent Na+:H+ antiporter subunit C|nr:NADH-quinone oxidoreductase subunit K [Bacteroidales bacterium]HPE43818.1 NADH-quinone oxidoreductase subunit K [Bacteroidales bacterium]